MICVILIKFGCTLTNLQKLLSLTSKCLTHNTSVEAAYSRLPQTFKCSREWVGGKWVSRSESRGGSLSVGLSVCVCIDMEGLSPHKTWTNKTGRSTHCVMSSWCHGDTNTCSTCATLLIQRPLSVLTGGKETTSLKIETQSHFFQSWKSGFVIPSQSPRWYKL